MNVLVNKLPSLRAILAYSCGCVTDIDNGCIFRKGNFSRLFFISLLQKEIRWVLIILSVKGEWRSDVQFIIDTFCFTRVLNDLDKGFRALSQISLQECAFYLMSCWSFLCDWLHFVRGKRSNKALQVQKMSDDGWFSVKLIEVLKLPPSFRHLLNSCTF